MGIRENTYIIFMGDNGTEEKFFDNPNRDQPNEQAHTRHTTGGKVNGGKHQACDAGTHVPLLIWGPKPVPRNQVCDDLIDIVDLFPTICELSETAIPGSIKIDGQSFLPQIHGEDGISRNWTLQGHPQKRDHFFDGSWRYFSKSDQLIDARKLPAEVHPGGNDPQADAARKRFRALSKQILRPPKP